MDLFVLRAVLGLDKSDYEQGISDARNSADEAGGGIGGALQNAAKIGTAALSAAANAASAFAGDSVQAGMNFDASMSNVAAISGAAGKDLEDLRNKAQEMGSTTKFSASEAADAMSYMAMAGWKTGDMLDGIEGIMNLAAASGENLATTSDIVTDALTAFGLTAGDSGHFADILAAASSNANTNVSMMGETFKYAAPIAGAMGFSAEDTAEAIGLMANAGIKASQAGTSLRTIMTAMTGPIDIAGEKLGKVSIQTTNADGSMRDLSDILADCRSAFSQLSESEKTQMAESIAGKNAMSGFLALMNAAPDDIAKLSGAIDNCDGAAERMAETMQDNLAGDITIFKSALEGAQIALSDELTPTLRQFVQYGSESLGTLTTAFKEKGIDGLMDALNGVVSEGLGMIVSALPEILQAGAGLLLALVQGIVDNLPALGDAAIQVVVMLATTIGEALPNLIPAAVGAITQIVTTLTDPSTLADLANAAMSIINGLTSGILLALPALVEAAPQIIANLAQGITENAPTLLENGVAIITVLVDSITENLPTLLDQAPVMIEQLLDAILNALPQLIEAAIQVIEVLTQGIIDNLPKLIEAVPRIITTIVTTIAQHLPEILTAGVNLILELVAGILQGIPKIGEAIGQVVSEVTGGLNDLPGKALEWGKDMMGNLADGIRGAVGKVHDAVGGVVGWIKRHLGFSEPEEGPLSDFHTYAPDMMELFAQGVRDNARMLQKEVDSAFDFGNSIVAPSQQMPAAASGWGREIVVPRQNNDRPIEIVVKLPDDTVLARAIHRMYDEEDQRMGRPVTRGAY